ncbi:MAG: hypothetical protein H7X70_04170 [Candidatus Kapabacteria bacterium]|nr:hypothetical protein [Candidatus Kapabacteria bacterium]
MPSFNFIAVFLAIGLIVNTSFVFAGNDRPVTAKSITTVAVAPSELEGVHFKMVDRLTKRTKTQDINTLKLSVSEIRADNSAPKLLTIEASLNGFVDVTLVTHSTIDNRIILESKGISSHAVVPGTNQIPIELGNLVSGEYTLRVSQGAIVRSMTFVVK